jgi:drug/metabolite transporter (DMT)-like permease
VFIRYVLQKIICSVTLGVAIFREYLGLLSWLGLAMIIVSAMYISVRQASRG